MAKDNTMATPFGVAVYPHVSKPDTVGKFADGKYKLQIEVSKEDLAQFKADFTAKVNPEKGSKLPWREKDGKLLITAKSKYAPLILDEKKREVALEEGEYLAGGSVVRALVEVGTYTGGYNLYLKKVQVKQLVTGTAGGGGFDDFSMKDDDENETADALDL